MKKRHILISDLLPYDSATKIHGDLRTGLKEFQCLLNALMAAWNAFQEQQYEKFDCLVGENACEIRALWVCKLANACTTVDRHLVLSSLDKTANLLNGNSLDALMQKAVSLKEVLQELDIALSAEEALLLKFFLLTEMKTLKSGHSLFRMTVAAPKNLLPYGDISPSFAKHLLSKVRRLVSEASVEFIRREAHNQQDLKTLSMVSETHTKAHNALTCTPMLWTYKTVLNLALEEETPIILHAKFLKKNAEDYELLNEEYVLFESREGSFVKTCPSHFNRERPACVIQGIVVTDETLVSKEEWHEKMDACGLRDVILAGAADHRQYPDAALDEQIHALKDAEYEHYKALAHAKGFSAENPSTFFIQHVYAVDAELFLENKIKIVPLFAQDEPVCLPYENYSFVGV